MNNVQISGVIVKTTHANTTPKKLIGISINTQEGEIKLDVSGQDVSVELGDYVIATGKLFSCVEHFGWPTSTTEVLSLGVKIENLEVISGDVQSKIDTPSAHHDESISKISAVILDDENQNSDDNSSNIVEKNPSETEQKVEQTPSDGVNEKQESDDIFYDEDLTEEQQQMIVNSGVDEDDDIFSSSKTTDDTFPFPIPTEEELEEQSRAWEQKIREQIERNKKHPF